MRCADCGADLDRVDVDQPCPNCGSTRRDATIEAPTATARATAESGGDAQVSCGECGLLLDEPPNTPPDQRQPCRNCGSTARSFAIHLGGTANMVVSAVGTSTVVDALDALVAQPAFREVIQARELIIRVHEPHQDAPGYVVELLDDHGQLLGTAAADDAADASLAVAMEMEQALKND